MYILKVKGKAKIPDYIQFRDDNFILLEYFRADRPFKNLHKYNLEGKEDELKDWAQKIPFGIMTKLEIK